MAAAGGPGGGGGAAPRGLRLLPLPVDPLTGGQLRPRDVFAPLQVRDEGLRAAGVDAVVERLSHYELLADSDSSGSARSCLMVLLPSVLRLTYDWCVGAVAALAVGRGCGHRRPP